MPYQISKEHVWVGAIPDHPDALAEKLRLLSQAGLNLELILARRDIPGRALLFVSPLQSVEEMLAAEEIGLAQEEDVRAVRVLGPDVPGVGARIATALAAADLNIRAYSAAVIGKRHITFLAFNSESDADEAVKVLKQALK
jgi:hypothetical protein